MNSPPKGRRLLGERVLSVWIDVDKAPDPDDDPSSYRALTRSVDKALGRATDVLVNDPLITHIDANIEIGETG